MSAHNRCDGWAQCPICPRPDNPRYPSDATDGRCAPRPLRRCPTTGVGCQQNRACCSLLNCDPDCLEFIPSPSATMSAINCTPNLPPSGWSVLGWRPGPPAMRTCPRTQYPSVPCAPPVRPPDPACYRPCEAGTLRSPKRPFVMRYVPDQAWPIKQPPCNPPPPVPPYTCRAIGSRRLTEQIQHKFSYPGYEGTPNGRHVLCKPCIDCYPRTGYWNSGSSRKPVKFYMATIPGPDD